MESLKNDSMQKGRVKVPEIYDRRQTVAVSWGKGSNFVNVTSCSSEIVQGVLWKNRAKTS